MAKIDHVATFSSTAHKRTVEEMRARRESVHDRGEEVYRRTGHMDPLVRVYGNVRKSKFAWTRNDDGTYTLVNPKRPYMFATDGTGSFGANVAKAFDAAPNIYAMLENNARTHSHQMDFSFSVFQDRDDRHDMIQVPEFESDNRFAEHMRLLIPDKNGGDWAEDYDYGIWYAANQVQADLWRYGEQHKGIFVLLLDATGRGVVEPRIVQQHLGVTIQSPIRTETVWQQLLQKFHGYVVMFGKDANWWKPVVGRNHLIEAPAHELFAEVQAGLVYATDNPNPSADGLYDFLRANGQGSDLSRRDSNRIWAAYETARIPFGAGANWMDGLPQAGDIFQHMTDLWPIGHERAGENPPPGIDTGEDSPSVDSPTSDEPRKPIDWSRF